MRDYLLGNVVPTAQLTENLFKSLKETCDMSRAHHRLSFYLRWHHVRT